MRAAFLVTAAYEGSSQIPSLPSALEAANIVERRCSEPDCAFQTTRLATERHLPLKLGEGLARLAPASTLFVYVTGYVTVSQTRGSALLLDGPRLKAMKWGKLQALLHTANAHSLVVVDAVAMPDTQPPLDQICSSIGGSLVDPNGAISAIVAVRAGSIDPGVAAPLPNLFAAVCDYLSAHRDAGTKVSDRAVFGAMEQERASFWSLGSAAFFPGRSEFPLLEARGTFAESQAIQHVLRSPVDVPATYASPLQSLPNPRLPTFPRARPDTTPPTPRPAHAAEAEHEPEADVSRDSDVDVPTPRRVFVLAQGSPDYHGDTPDLEVPFPDDAAAAPSSPASPRPSAVRSDGAQLEGVNEDDGSSPFDMLRDSWSGVQHGLPNADEDTGTFPLPSDPGSAWRQRDREGSSPPEQRAAPHAMAPTPLPLPGSRPPPRIDPPRPSSKPASTPREPAPDSIPPSIPSAAWSGLYHPELDQDDGFFAAPEPPQEGAHGDSDVPGLDAEQLLQAAAQRPVESRLHEPSWSGIPAASAAAPHATYPERTLPPPPVATSSSLPPPGVVRRALTPPPSRVPPPSLAPASQSPPAADDIAPVSSREVQAAVLAHLDSAQRRAAAGDRDTATEHLKRALVLGIPEPALQADVRSRLASLFIDQGRTADALAQLERATQLHPKHPIARSQLIGLLRQLGRHARLRELGEEQLGDLKAPEGGSPAKAGRAETAPPPRTFPPPTGRSQGVRALASTTAQTEANDDERTGEDDWTAVVEAQVRLAEAHETAPTDRARALGTAARIVAVQLGDELRAVELIRRAWEANQSTIGALLDAGRFCQSRTGLSALISLIETVLPRLSSEHDVVSLAVFGSQLCQSQLHEPDRAARLTSAAVRLAPNAAALRVELSGACEALGARELAEEQARVALLIEPVLPDAYAALSHVARKDNRTDLAWRAASVAVGLGSADPAVIALAREFAQEHLPSPIRALNAQDWARLARDSDPRALQEQLGRCLVLIEPALRMAHAQRRAAGASWMKSAQEIDLASSTATLARIVGWTSRLVGSEPLRLWITDEAPRIGRLELAPEPSLLVDRSLASGFNLLEYAFLSARVLTYSRPEWFLLGLFGGPSQLLDWVELCYLAASEHPADAGTPASRRATIGILQAQLPSEARGELIALWRNVPNGQLLDALTGLYAQAARVAGRLGMLACGTPALAVELCRRLPLEHLSPKEQLADLAAFAVGPVLDELRTSLGIALGAEAASSMARLAPTPSL